MVAKTVESRFGVGRLLLARGWPAILVGLLFCIFLLLAFTTEEFLTLFNFKTILRDAALYGIMGVGLTFVTLSGNFFLLSMKETAALAIVIFAGGMANDYGFLLSLTAALGAAGLAGLVQGILIGYGGNPIVVTLGGAGLLYGMASWLSDNQVISFSRPNDAEWLGTGAFLGLPSITWAFLLIAAMAELVLRYTTFGREVYLVGASRATAHATGHRALPVAIKVCVIASLCAGFVAAAFAAQMSSAQANYFSSEFGSAGDMTILVIATVMVGGNAIQGGVGSTIRTSFGALFIAAIDNMMVLRGLSSGPRVLAIGIIIVASILAFGFIRRGSKIFQ